MTICCLPNCAYLSETSRMIAVYKQLIAKDEKAIIATHGGTYDFIFKEEGLNVHYVKPNLSQEQSQEMVAANRGERGLRGFYTINELRVHVKSEINFFKENNISVVLTGFTLSSALSTRVLGIPLAVTHLGSWVPPIFERKMQPFWDDVGYPITRLIPDAWKNNFVNWLFPRIKFFTKAFTVVAKELGVEPFKNYIDLLMGDLTMVTDVPEILSIPLDELENWIPTNPQLYSRKPRLKYVGAIYAQLFGDVSEAVKEFLKTEKPKIYVALTSSRPDYVSSVYSILKDMEAQVLFCSTIHTNDFEESSNILVRNHFPSHKIMPLVDLVIIHGGQGSIQSAVTAGVPILGFPLHIEQNFNLKMIERHGAGICSSLKRLKKGTLRPMIEQILSGSSFKSNMQRLKSYQDRYNGPENVVKSLQELARTENN
ncbi:MAG: glycosyltransferase [Candidatus Hermodarchaeota archaeon]